MDIRPFLLFCFLFIGTTLPAQDALAIADSLARQGQYAASSEQLLAFIEGHPDRRFDVARAWWLYARNQRNLGSWSTAYSGNQRSFNERRQLHSTDIVDNYLLFAELWLEKDDPEQALSALEDGFQQMIENPVRYAALYQLQGEAYSRMGEYVLADEAFAQAEAVLSIELGDDSPTLAPLWYAWAGSALRQGDFDQAARYWQAVYTQSDEPWLRARALLHLWAYHPLLK